MNNYVLLLKFSSYIQIKTTWNLSYGFSLQLLRNTQDHMTHYLFAVGVKFL